MNNIVSHIRAFFLTILYVILVIPYGIDAPSTNYIRDCSLEKGALTCEQTEAGAEATFTVLFERSYRPLLTKHAFDDFEMKVFKMDDSLVFNAEELYFYRIVDDETIPAVNMTYSCEVENDRYLVHDGEMFTGIIHVVFPEGTAPGVYSVAISTTYRAESVYQDVLIVP